MSQSADTKIIPNYKQFEKKNIAPVYFLMSYHVFDRVWHDGLLFKLKSFLLALYYLILKSYLEYWFFTIKHNSSYSSNYKDNARVIPRRSDLSPILYNIYTEDFPKGQTAKVSLTTLTTYPNETNNACIKQRTLKIE